MLDFEDINSYSMLYEWYRIKGLSSVVDKVMSLRTLIGAVPNTTHFDNLSDELAGLEHMVVSGIWKGFRNAKENFNL